MKVERGEELEGGKVIYVKMESSSSPLSASQQTTPPSSSPSSSSPSASRPHPPTPNRTASPSAPLRETNQQQQHSSSYRHHRHHRGLSSPVGVQSQTQQSVHTYKGSTGRSHCLSSTRGMNDLGVEKGSAVPQGFPQDLILSTTDSDTESVSSVTSKSELKKKSFSKPKSTLNFKIHNLIHITKDKTRR